MKDILHAFWVGDLFSLKPAEPNVVSSPLWPDVIREVDDQKVEQTEARELPISPKFLWRIWAWVWVYTVLLMTNSP